MPELATCFRYHRQFGKSAMRAIELAREDIANGKTRYPRESYRFGENSPFKSGGDSLRWIERPAEIGLRKVGFADQVYKGIEHNGWYTDDEGDRETMRGIVYQFPARDGKPRFVSGYADPCNTDKEGNRPAALSFEIFDDEKEAARNADSIANYAAEEERDYNRAWQAGRKFEELGDDISRARKACLSLIRETKAACEAIKQYAGIKATIRAAVAEYVSDIRKAQKERDKLERDFGDEAAFKDA